MSRGSSFTLPLILARGPDRDQPGRRPTGDAPGRRHHLRSFRACSSTCCCSSYYSVRPDERGGEMTTERRRTRGRRRSRLRPLGPAGHDPSMGSWPSASGSTARRTIPHGFAQLRPGRDPGQPAPGGRRRRALPGQADTSGAVLPLPGLRRLQVAGGGGVGAGRGADPAPGRRPPTRRSVLVAAAQRPDGYLNSYVQVSGGGGPVRAISPGATSSTASATWSRRRSPGSGRSATTGCWPSRSRPPTGSTRSSGPTGRGGSARHPASRWRWSS